MDEKIRCCIRHFPVKRTPEEVVRQNFLECLITQKGFSPALIAVEVSLEKLVPLKKVPAAKRRVDIVCYMSIEGDLHPILLVECKQRYSGDSVAAQLLGYQRAIEAPFFGVVFRESIDIYRRGVCFYSGMYGEMPDRQELFRRLIKVGL